MFNPRFDPYHHPDNRKDVMSTLDRAATWDDRTEAEAVAAALKERDRQHRHYAFESNPA